MMSLTNHNLRPLAVQLVGAIEHPDFRDAAALIRASARCENAPCVSPEVVVMAQSRPGQISLHDVESLQRRWPLAGIVAIAGSWCEGGTRTDRPLPGVKRFYWYEFPAWWRQQLALRNSGLCPTWSRPTTDATRTIPISNPQSAARRSSPKSIRNSRNGMILLSATNQFIAEALADVLHDAGYATAWHPSGRPTAVVRGAIAGIWDGGQLDDREAMELKAFCRLLDRDNAPVVALLDFPRRDRYELALQLGASAVLGKPWMNADLMATIEECANRNACDHAAARRRAA